MFTLGLHINSALISKVANGLFGGRSEVVNAPNPTWNFVIEVNPSLAPMLGPLLFF